MQITYWTRTFLLFPFLMIVFIVGSNSKCWAQAIPTRVDTLTEQRLELFRAVRDDQNQKQAELKLLAWTEDMTKAYWKWRLEEIDQNLLDLFKRNRGHLDKKQAAKDRLDWPEGVMRQYWTWRNIEVDAETLRLQKLHAEHSSKLVDLQKLNAEARSKTVQKYNEYISYFLKFHEQRGSPGFDTKIYNNAKNFLKATLISKEVPEILDKLEPLRSILMAPE